MSALRPGSVEVAARAAASADHATLSSPVTPEERRRWMTIAAAAISTYLRIEDQREHFTL